MSIRMIWFDFGGVLSPTVPELFAAYQRKTGLTREQVESAWNHVAEPFEMEGLAPIELALITQREWGRRLGEALTLLYPGIDLSRSDLENFGDQWFADLVPNAAMIDLLERARSHGLGVGILTNNIIEWERPWRKLLSIDHLVDAVVDSCKVGCRKPQARIFQIAAEQVGRSPEECLLIDDLPGNCGAARLAGWQAVVFENDAQTEASVCALTGLPRSH